MNVLICSYHYPAPKETGFEPDTMIVHYFARNLAKDGHRVQVVHLHFTPVKELRLKYLRYLIPRTLDHQVDGIPVRLIRYQMLTPHRFCPEWFQKKTVNRQIRELKQQNGWKPDKVFVHFPTRFVGITEVTADQVPSLAVMHNIDISILQDGDPKGRIREYVSHFTNLGYRNKKGREYLETVFSQSLIPVYTGISRELLADPKLIEEKKKRSHDKLKLLYVGRLLELKNVDITVKAFRKLSFPAQLTVIGDGPELEHVKELAGDDPSITFHGWMERKDAVRAMDDSDVFIMVSAPETYGMVYVESMARGCVDIATRGEGFDGLIRDGENGFLLNPRNVDQLVECLEKLHTMPEEEWSRLIGASYGLATNMMEDKLCREEFENNR